MLWEHAATIEWPSVAWLKEMYPGRYPLDAADALSFAAVWLGYTRSWEPRLARQPGTKVVRRRQ